MFYAAGRVGELVRSEDPAPPERAPERLGNPSEERPEGRLLWLHTNRPEDTGVVHAIVHELSELRDEPFHALVTTKQSGLPVHQQGVPPLHQLVPGETAGSVARFLDHWSPDVAVMLGPPDRPLLIGETHQRGCPLFLAATRRGDSSTGARLGLLPASLVSQFDLCLAPSAAEAEALRKHTDDERVIVTGPLTDTAVALPCDSAEVDRLAGELGGRPVWLADGVGLDELHMLADAHRRAIRASHRLLLVVSPSNPKDGSTMAGWFDDRSWRVGQRSSDDAFSEDVQVYIADVADETGIWYRLAPTTYIGGTFKTGSENVDPFGPAALGSAVIHGPETDSAASRFQRLRAANATKVIAKPEDLGEMVYGLLSPDKAAALAHAGWLATTESAHAVEMLASRIDEALDLRETIDAGA